MASRPNKSARRNRQSLLPLAIAAFSHPRAFLQRTTGGLIIDYDSLRGDYRARNKEVDRINAYFAMKNAGAPVARDLLRFLSDKKIPLEYRRWIGYRHADVLGENADREMLATLKALVTKGELEPEIVNEIFDRVLMVNLPEVAFEGFATFFRNLISDEHCPEELRKRAYRLLWARSSVNCDANFSANVRWLLSHDLGSNLDDPWNGPVVVYRGRLMEPELNRTDVDFVKSWLDRGTGHYSARAIAAILYSEGIDVASLANYFVEIFGEAGRDSAAIDILLKSMYCLRDSTREYCASRIIGCEHLSSEARLAWLPYLDRRKAASVLRLARDSRLSVAERERLAPRVIQNLLGDDKTTGELYEYASRLAAQDDSVWRELIYCDRLASLNPQILKRLILAPQTSDLLVLLAGIRLQRCPFVALTELAGPEVSARIGQAMVSTRLPEFVRRTASSQLADATRRASLLDIARRADIPVAERLCHLDSFPIAPFEVSATALALWDLAKSVDESEVQIHALRLLKDCLHKSIYYPVEFLIDQLLRDYDYYVAPNSTEEARRAFLFKAFEERRDAEQFFGGRVWTKDDLIHAAQDSARTPHYRVAALIHLKLANSLAHEDYVKVLDIARSADGPVQEAAFDSLRLLRELRAELRGSPNSPFWQYARALLSFPDIHLAIHCLQRCEIPEPPPEGWEAWFERNPLDCPPSVVLPLLNLLGRRAVEMNETFRAARKSATLTHELTSAILTICGPEESRGVRLREAREWLFSGSQSANAPKRDPHETIEKLREIAIINALNGLPEEVKEKLLKRRLYGLTRRLYASRHTSSPKDVFTGAASLDDICDIFATQLQHVSSRQLRLVSQKTYAPLVLASHYLLKYPQGLPLLGSALSAASKGSSAWKAFRYDSSDGKRQLAFLSSKDRRSWQENLVVADRKVFANGTTEKVVADVRACFREALSTGVFSPDVSKLVAQEGDIQAILLRYQDAQREIGRAVNGQREPLENWEFPGLPKELNAHLTALLDRNATREGLLKVNKYLRAASDLIRLTHLDPAALIRNDLVAEGETLLQGEANTPRLIARLSQLEHQLRNPQARAATAETTGVSPRLADTFQTARSLIDRLGIGAARATLVVEECDDFQTLLEIGHHPYGQGSCQDYASSGEQNVCLMGYVTDAMTKALIVRRTGTSDPAGLLARAIVRVGKALDGGVPVLVLERIYPKGAELHYGPLIEDAARQFAETRGWRLSVTTQASEATVDVRIPGSRNGRQYVDSWRLLVGKTSSPALSGPYVLRLPINSPKLVSASPDARTS